MHTHIIILIFDVCLFSLACLFSVVKEKEFPVGKVGGGFHGFYTDAMRWVRGLGWKKWKSITQRERERREREKARDRGECSYT